MRTCDTLYVSAVILFTVALIWGWWVLVLPGVTLALVGMYQEDH